MESLNHDAVRNTDSSWLPTALVTVLGNPKAVCIAFCYAYDLGQSAPLCLTQAARRSTDQSFRDFHSIRKTDGSYSTAAALERELVLPREMRLNFAVIRLSVSNTRR